MKVLIQRVLEVSVHGENVSSIEQELYVYFSGALQKHGIEVQNGIFQADMKIRLINDEPATFILEKSGI